MYQRDTKEIENVTKLLASYLIPNNIYDHLLKNLFTLESKLIPSSFITVPNKPSLPTSNFLISENKALNLDKPSQNDLESQSLSYTFENYETKTIINTTSIRGIYVFQNYQRALKNKTNYVEPNLSTCTLLVHFIYIMQRQC